MSRALAHIEKIVGLFPIEGADQIEAAQVLGWYVVVKKGEFKVDDLCVFFEIDSFLNSTDERYAFLEPRFINWQGKRGARLKTIKLRGQISQGLTLPLNSFPEIKNPAEGQDVTDLLKIEKWEPAEEASSNRGGSGKSAGLFPDFIQKTDQTRVQSLQGLIDRYLDEEFEVTIKLDGSSMTVFSVNPSDEHYAQAKLLTKKKPNGWYEKMKSFIETYFSFLSKKKEPDLSISGICSRNILLKNDDLDSHFVRYVEENGIRAKIHGLSAAIQGELISPSIQGNHEKVSDFEYHVFDIFDIANQKYFDPSYVKNLCDTLKLNHVPVLFERITLREFVEGETDNTKIVQKILDKAEGSGMNPGVKREGLVFKHLKSDFSFKAISNSYLLKKEKGMKE